MIRQFTFHKPKEILQPTLWLFLSQACSMLPAILAYMAIYTLGEAFVPPYTLDLFRLITLAALGVGCFVLQYIVELIPITSPTARRTGIRRTSALPTYKSCAGSHWASSQARSPAN